MNANAQDSTASADADDVQRLRGIIWAAALAIAILITAGLCYWDLIPMPFI